MNSQTYNIPNYSNYFVDSNGDLFTRNWKNCGITRKVKPAKDKKGYLRTVMVSDNGVYSTIRVHRVVATAAIPNHECKPFINHINGVKDDNRPSNLEWCTAKENTRHAIDNGLFVFQTPERSINKEIKRGSKNGQSILTESDVIKIRAMHKPRIVTRAMLAEQFGVSEYCIKDVLSRKSWNHV